MARYRLEATSDTLHGKFTRELLPALTISAGDTIECATFDASWGLKQRTNKVEPRHKVAPRKPEWDDGHALTGPIAINGAEPGMVLAVEVGNLVPGAWGWTAAGGSTRGFNDRLGVATPPAALLHWSIDRTTMTASNQRGHTVALRPFMGVMGVAPAEPGLHSTIPPRRVGGNIDCRELITGSTLFLPIEVPGALFSVGDGHGAQGDGEVGGTGLECPMQNVELTFTLRDDLPLSMPCASTPAGWITFGFDPDLNEATVMALNGMLDHLTTQYRLDRNDALALASIVVSLHITQIANGVHGVHAILPHDSVF